MEHPPIEPNTSRQENEQREGPAQEQLPLNSAAPLLPQAGLDEQLASDLESIPDQMAFRIGDVAELAGLKPYVLRYWETEFEVLSPKKSKNNQRMYSKRDVETVLIIKKLLYRDRYSIMGAKAALRSVRRELKKERQWKLLVAEHLRVQGELKVLLTAIRKARNHFQLPKVD